MGVDNVITDFKRSRGLAWPGEIKATHVQAGKKAFAGVAKGFRCCGVFEDWLAARGKSLLTDVV
jgi:hypothetical protein